MSSFDQFDKKAPSPLETNDPKVEDYLKNYSQRDKINELFRKKDEEQKRAVELASRSPFSTKTPEEQQFMEQNLDPLTQGMIGGGAMGRIANVAAEAPVAAKAAFPAIQKMFQVGDVAFPAANAAEALKVKSALENAGKVGFNKILTQIK